MARAPFAPLKLAVLFLFPGLLALPLSGCLGGVRSASVDASKAAVPVIVDQSLKSFEAPDNRDRVREIMGTPEMQAAVEETARALVAGAVAPSPETEARAGELMARLTHQLTDALAADIPTKLEPVMTQAARDVSDEAFSSANRRAIMQMVEESTRAALRTTAREIPESIGPAVREAIVRSLQSPELKGAVSEVAARATRAALTESRDVIVELRKTDEGPFVRLERFLEATVIGLALVGALTAGVLGWSLHILRSAKSVTARLGPTRATNEPR